MKRFLLFTLVALAAFSPPLWSQAQSGPFTITSSSSPCARIGTGAQATVVVTVRGTFSATLQPEISTQGQTPDNTQVTPTSSSTAQSTITAAGTYKGDVAANDTFLVCVTSYVSGTATIWLSTAPQVSKLVLQGGSASTVPFSGVQAGTNVNALVEDTNGSISPADLGQTAGNQLWMQPAIPVFTGNYAATGGSLGASPYFVQVVYNTAAGNSLPSIEERAGVTYNGSIPITSNCSVGPSCSIALDAITLPSGYTSWSAYMASTSGSEQLVSTCTNISSGVGCTIQAVGSGAAVPTVNTAFLQPPNVQASECPPSVIPSIFLPDNSGNYRTWAGVDPNSTNSQTSGSFEICHRTWFTDRQVTPPQGNNSFVIIDHNFGVGTSTSNQDRALWVGTQTPSGDSTTRYGLEGVQSELDFNCNGCTINGSPDAEVTAVSAQLSTAGAATNWSPTGYSSNAVQGRVFRNGAGFDTTGISGVYGDVENNNTTASGGSILSALRGRWLSNQSAAGLRGVGLRLDPPGNTNFGTIEGLYVSAGGFTPRSGTDWFIDQRTHNWNSLLNGVVGLTGIDNTDGGTQAMPVNASVNLTGSNTIKQITASWTGITAVACSGGSSAYTYELVAVDGNGGLVASASSTSGAACANPLTSGSPATVQLTTPSISNAQFRQAARIDVYRTGGPMTTGKVGSLTCNADLPILGCTNFSDTGLSASGSAPTINTTGSESAYKYLTASNCAAVGSAASPSIAACGSASAGVFSCDPTASGATCTVNTTAVTAASAVLITPSAADSSLLSVTCNTTADVPTGPRLAAKVAATSFTINLGTVAVNPTCYEYQIVN